MLRTAALVALLIGCGDREPSGGDDAGVPVDAGRSDAGLETGPLRIASWNLREFPFTPDAVGGAAEIIGALDLDVVILLEVENRTAFSQLAFDLPELEPTIFERAGAPIGTALLVRRGRATRTSNELLFELDTAAFPRPAVHVELDVGSGATLTVLAIHLKAGTTADDEMRRALGVMRVEEWVRSRVDGPEPDAVLVIGDFNEAFSDPMAAAVFAPLLDEARYRFLTRELQEMGTATFLPADIVLDHAVTTVAAPPATATVPPLDETVPMFETTISDHLPIVVELAL
jgi:endonuclease/exonuclease/phosphatase family metal-dependent hydrolase